MFSKRDLMNMEGIMVLQAIKDNAGKRNAAKRLNTSVDTLNKYLMNLEAELGVPLVSSDERGCTLTDYGEKVVEVAGSIKKSLQQAYSVVDPDRKVKGEVKIAYDRNLRCNIYNKTLGDALAAHPDMSIHVDMLDYVPDLSHLSYDIYLGYEVPKGKDLVVVASKEVECGYFASFDYIQKNSFPKDLEDLAKNHRLIFKHNEWKDYETSRYLVQKAKKAVCYSNSTYVINKMVMGGAGISIMPVYFAKEKAGLVYIDNIPCEPKLTMYLVSHRSVKDILKVRVALDYYIDIINSI